MSRRPDPAPRGGLERAMGRWREVSSGEEDNALFHKEERCALTFEGGSIHELQDLTVEQAAFIRCGRDFAQKSGLHLFFSLQHPVSHSTLPGLNKFLQQWRQSFPYASDCNSAEFMPNKHHKSPQSTLQEPQVMYRFYLTIKAADWKLPCLHCKAFLRAHTKST